MAECPWPIDVTECCKESGFDPNDPDQAKIIAQIIAQVSEMMSRWSGYAYGGCKTIRPLDPCGTCSPSGCCSGNCIRLHDVSDVCEVRVAGEVVPEDRYHFSPARGTLCSPDPWPVRDSLADAVGSLEVDVSTGARPDAWALATAKELACELLLSCANKKCRLPRNATTVTTQGFTIRLSADELRFILPSVSAWVSAVNPAGAVRPARVLSPELRQPPRPPRAPWSRW